MNRPQIFLGDFLHALRELDIESPETAREVMRMLSLESWAELAAAPREVRPAPVELGAVMRSPTVAGFDAAPADPDRAARAAPSPAAADAPRGLAPAVVTQVEGGAPAPRPAWAAVTLPLARGRRGDDPAPEPLFQPLQQRAILAALAAGRVDDDAIDLPRLVEILGRGETVQALPTRRAWGLRRGLQVLVDDGPGMAPFRADLQQLRSRLDGLFAAGSIEFGRFEGDPSRGVRVEGRKRGAWRPPAARTPVLVVSDLGLSPDAPRPPSLATAGWLVFAEQAAGARVPLRTLIPYPAARWPAALAGALNCVAWDRRTRVADVRGLLERSAP